jgi:hypothetical protein
VTGIQIIEGSDNRGSDNRGSTVSTKERSILPLALDTATVGKEVVMSEV